MKRWLLTKLIGKETMREVLLCLNGAKYCMSHRVMASTKEFELKHIIALIDKLEGR